jgi:hypothetical protein
MNSSSSSFLANEISAALHTRSIRSIIRGCCLTREWSILTCVASCTSNTATLRTVAALRKARSTKQPSRPTGDDPTNLRPATVSSPIMYTRRMSFRIRENRTGSTRDIRSRASWIFPNRDMVSRSSPSSCTTSIPDMTVRGRRRANRAKVVRPIEDRMSAISGHMGLLHMSRCTQPGSDSRYEGLASVFFVVSVGTVCSGGLSTCPVCARTTASGCEPGLCPQ